jgi:hypothetical protein
MFHILVSMSPLPFSLDNYMEACTAHCDGFLRAIEFSRKFNRGTWTHRKLLSFLKSACRQRRRRRARFICCKD